MTLSQAALTQPNNHLWSVANYHHMVEAGILSDCHVELLQGKIVDRTPEGPLHTHSGEGTAQFLRQHLQGQTWIREAHPITLNTSKPEPDLAIVRLPWSQYRQRHPDPSEVYWLIEISDSSIAIDSGYKLKIYTSAGIPEYWIVNLRKQQVSVYRQPESEHYRSVETYQDGELTPLAFPTLRVSVSLLLAQEV
ncbi:Uma2 family endonuclease [Acaryochloris marina]|uniref:Uma2 family endonuclease n=1 Tax=Acaryochloris marina TaxID=155978 RepID=UPI0005A21DC5|nr:Uma2 family endonuclease [Acaryochloris marina]BDM81875.1 hypothetical protein AM10699_47400 [Acaryochloris marina MBIC10699]